jgi:hypothetical protein
MKRYFSYFIFIICLATILFVGYINVDAVLGTFGDGPPYYGQTTNMDKWENPIPLLAVIDIVTAIFIGVAIRCACKALK